MFVKGTLSNNLRYKLIYFFGSDGTGKTTHAKLTYSYLKKKGYKVWRSRIKQHHTLSYLFLKLLEYNRNNSSKKALNYYGFDGQLCHKIKTPWKILEFISLMPAITYRVLLPLLLGYIIVCDRYIIDTLVTLSYFLKDPKLLSSIPSSLLVKFFPRNNLLIYLDTNTDIAIQRKREEPLTNQLIENYKKMYGIIIKRLGLPVISIDTSIKSIEDVHETIMQYIGPM